MKGRQDDVKASGNVYAHHCSYESLRYRNKCNVNFRHWTVRPYRLSLSFSSRLTVPTTRPAGFLRMMGRVQAFRRADRGIYLGWRGPHFYQLSALMTPAAAR